MNTKVLIIRFSSIGDIVLTSPVIRCIKTQRKDIELHFCTKATYKGIIENNPYIDKRYYLVEDGHFEGEDIYPRLQNVSPLQKLIKQLKKEKYDYIIDLHNNLRTFIIKLCISAKTYSFNKKNFHKWLYVNFKINRLPNVHIVDRYMETVKPLGIKNDGLGLQYFIPENDHVDRNTLPEAHQHEFVVYAIGAKHYTKKLPVDKMIELCDKINKPVILLGDKNDHETGEKVARFFQSNVHTAPYEQLLQEMGKKTVIFNGCGKYNLNQSASLIRQASVVFSHDTGLMHIAAAFKKEIYSIWGNTTPFFGMYPYKTKFKILENKVLKCRPCSKLGYKKCPKGHFKCMKELKLDLYLP